jgi:coenzyme F420-0:L-glutamate ligase/coenzyme F420-1:gamma-L-glutamate ligase
MTGDLAAVHLFPIIGLPEIAVGDDLGMLIFDALRRSGLGLVEGDVLVVTHKAVAKAEGAIVDLCTIEPSPFAQQLADEWGRDARHIEVVLRESRRIVRMDRGIIIAETRHGLVCANAGVDRSNLASDDEVCTLPEDADRSATQIANKMRELSGCDLGVIVSDTFGRAWREGLTNVAIGVAGIRPIRDYVGMPDSHGRPLTVTALAIADELAGAAELVMGKLDRVPAAIVRGYKLEAGTGSARELLRKPEADMFR